MFSPTCSTRDLLVRLGVKWTSVLVKLGDDGGEVGFAELQQRAPGISRKMLAQTLRGLEADGLVTRRVEATVPPAVHYGLTPLGPILTARRAAGLGRDTHAGRGRAPSSARARRPSSEPDE